MTETTKPAPQLVHYERRNNVMLKVFDDGSVDTHETCKSINLAKKLSTRLQKSGATVKVDQDAKNFIKDVRKHKVLTKPQSVKKTVTIGPRLTDEEARSLERSLLRSVT